jgi:hypothetical protein
LSCNDGKVANQALCPVFRIDWPVRYRFLRISTILRRDVEQDGGRDQKGKKVVGNRFVTASTIDSFMINELKTFLKEHYHEFEHRIDEANNLALGSL